MTDSQAVPQEDILITSREEPRFLPDPSLIDPRHNDELRQKLFGPLPFRWSRLQTSYSNAVPSSVDKSVGLNHSLLSSTTSRPRLRYLRVSILSGLLSLPIEIFASIICNLDFYDLQKLLQASSILYTRYRGDPGKLPRHFWQSRFWIYGETGFARSICPPSYSGKD